MSENKKMCEFLYFEEKDNAIYSKETGQKVVDINDETHIYEYQDTGLLKVSTADTCVLYDYRGNLLPHFENGGKFIRFRRFNSSFYTVKTSEGEQSYLIPCIRRGSFVIERDEKAGQCVVSTVKGKKIGSGVDFNFYQPNPLRLYIGIKNKDDMWTVYDEKGIPEPKMTNVRWVGCHSSTDSFEIRKNLYSDYETVLTRRQNRNRRATYSICAALVCLGALWVSRSCQKEEQQLNEFAQQDATYLGVSDGVLLFDTDGDKETAELGADLHRKSRTKIMGKMYKKEGQCRKITHWCDITGLSIRSFDKVNEN